MKKSLFWGIIRIFPLLIIAAFMIARIGQGAQQYTSMSAFLSDITTFMDNFAFTPIIVPLLSVFNTLGWQYQSGTVIVIALIAYEILVLFLQVLYEFLAFIPKFCIKVINKEKEKTRK